MNKNKSYQKYNQTVKGQPRKWPLFAIIALVVLIGGSGYYLVKQSKNSQAPSTTQTGQGKDTINLNPPTPQEKNDTEQHKDDLVNQNPPAPQPPNTQKQVQPVISYADRAVINSYVPGVFEDGGTCTATLTQGSQTITKTSDGFENASYTQCTPFKLTDENLGTGTWSAIVTYKSNTAEGSSSAATIK